MRILNIYFWKNILDWPFSFCREVKWFVQRGHRGYADIDCCDIDYYIAGVITKMLKELKENQTGIPLWQEHESEEMATKRWNEILDSIIYTFKCAEKIAGGDSFYTEEKDRKEYEELSKATTIDLMTKEECERYRLGWKYFQKHFFSLWD